MKKVFPILFVLFLLGGIARAETKSTITISPKTPQPGDAVFVTLDKNQTVATSSFNGQPIYSFTYQEKPHLVFAVPLSQKPGTYSLKITFANGGTHTEKIKIIKRSFPKVVLGIPEKLNLTPQALDQALVAVKKDLQSTFASSSQAILFQKPFGLPLFNNKRMGSPYGEIRQTGNSIIRHLGTDFTAPEGKPIAAMNDGVVVKAYLDSLYGNSIILDHGGHIFTMYLHLQKMNVRAGDLVKQGQIIGTVGQTGYATAPHLHLTIKVGETSIDPLHFIRDFK